MKNVLLFAGLFICLGQLVAGQATAQPFTVLYSFSATYDSTNTDGAEPRGGLILYSNTLYGTAGVGGTSGEGTIFAVNTNGAGFTNFHTFSGGSSIGNTNGSNPLAGLLFWDGMMFGTTQYGGSSGYGTVFRINPDGSGFTNLHNFSVTSNLPPYGNSDGTSPNAALLLSGETLYGTAYGGGCGGNGTVFAVNTDGTGFTNLHNFTQSVSPFFTNTDGANPVAGLILSGNTLYGTTLYGGSSQNGTIFAVNTDGTGFTNLHNFTATPSSFPYTNSDGTYARSTLLLSGSILYGSAGGGGSSGNGTIFSINNDGTGFTNLHNFTASFGSYSTNSDGAEPNGSLILSGNTLYGTAFAGGISGSGTIFAIKSDGTRLATLYNFTGFNANTNSDGSRPDGQLVLLDNSLYGEALEGGFAGDGTVFSLSLPIPPQLAIIPYGENVILTWPTNAYALTLECATNLASEAWRPVLLGTITIGGQNVVIDRIFGTQQFYRLSW